MPTITSTGTVQTIFVSPNKGVVTIKHLGDNMTESFLIWAGVQPAMVHAMYVSLFRQSIQLNQTVKIDHDSAGNQILHASLTL